MSVNKSPSFSFSEQQRKIINAPLKDTSVIACAGSGKTETAVHRLVHIRKNLPGKHSNVALLSFSNIAVNTFKQRYNEIIKTTNNIFLQNKVTIQTLDSFIIKHILNPHAYRTMKCDKLPFLLTGNENFLNNDKYKFWIKVNTEKKRPLLPKEINNIKISIKDNKFHIYFPYMNKNIPIEYGLKSVIALAKIGAYTHEFGKFWAIFTLLKEPKLLKILSEKFQHILIDESQDIGVLHEVIISAFREEGSIISLIGDPNQAIYEFADADGCFSKGFDDDKTVNSYSLNVNYRSIKEVVELGNKIVQINSVAHKKSTNKKYGVFYCTYRKGEEDKLYKNFNNAVLDLGLSVNSTAILHRAKIDNLNGRKIGQGLVLLLSKAAIERDQNKNYKAAFELICKCVISLISNADENLFQKITKGTEDKEGKLLKIWIWNFTRSPEIGLPIATLKGQSEWLPKLQENMKALLDKINNETQLITQDIGRKITKRNLDDQILVQVRSEANAIRVDTVHKAKGESIDAIMYLGSNASIKDLLGDELNENKRIGYVAITRARKFFVLALNETNINQHEAKLIELGLTKYSF